MKSVTIKPEDCKNCPFFEFSKFAHQCRYYRKGFYTIPEGKADFCKVEIIEVKERE